MKAICIIPARYASTRLPGKPLRLIAGVPMICRVYDRATQASRVSSTVVATDDQRIFDAVSVHGGQALMTRADHPTGTDRLAEAAQSFPDADLIVNVQGDEPLINPELIDRLIAAFDNDERLSMATIAVELTERNEIDNPNNVKVVTDRAGYALYFSRSAIPFERNSGRAKVYKHIGIYAYRRQFLLEYASMEPTPLEQAESLEQLRALENGHRIKVLISADKFIGVDTEEDLQLVNKKYNEVK